MVWSSPICPSILNGADVSLNYVVNSYLSRRIDLLSSHRPMVRVSSDQSIRTEGRPSKLGFLAMLFTPPPNNPKNYENRVVRVKEILFPCLSER